MSTATNKNLFPGTLHNSMLCNSTLKIRKSCPFHINGLTIQVYISQLMRKKRLLFFFPT